MKTKIKYLLVLVLASFVFAGCCTMHRKAAQMEYKVVFLQDGDADKQLNEFCKDGGWKLFTVVPKNNLSGEYILERPIH
jgi:outer membrane biogenesis lipoprotein LolB